MHIVRLYYSNSMMRKSLRQYNNIMKVHWKCAQFKRLHRYLFSNVKIPICAPRSMNYNGMFTIIAVYLICTRGGAIAYYYKMMYIPIHLHTHKQSTRKTNIARNGLAHDIIIIFHYSVCGSVLTAYENTFRATKNDFRRNTKTYSHAPIARLAVQSCSITHLYNTHTHTHTHTAALANTASVFLAYPFSPSITSNYTVCLSSNRVR